MPAVPETLETLQRGFVHECCQQRSPLPAQSAACCTDPHWNHPVVLRIDHASPNAQNALRVFIQAVLHWLSESKDGVVNNARYHFHFMRMLPAD
jgi:hypothetical protein